jgi:anti-sigma regulatory factor (Ser/Thr protein kinase)
VAQGQASDRLLIEFSVASAPGNERIVMQRVAEAVAPLALPATRLERLKTAVAEATLNAMEHGNHYQAERPVAVRVFASKTQVCVTVVDEGGAESPFATAETPDIDLKLAGKQSPRGWGLFLIKRMVDEVSDERDGDRHAVHLTVRLPAN